ncbi:hypothetical protein [Fretibacter rubidus]|uniref:hypothetical protein n=1 Tax=Fretibacter rubidus TaxID=570162 RepID=UPI00352A4254
MTQTLPATVPSLARAFEPERDRLRNALSTESNTADIVVIEARRALDKAGASFANTTDDPTLQKAGLWLIEMVKSGAAVLDHGTEARVQWTEVAGPKTSIWTGRGLFYGAAAVFGAAGFVQGSALVMFAAATLAGLRAFDPAKWKQMLPRLPFVKKSTPLLEDAAGRAMRVNATVEVDADGFINALTDALHTADHILLRLAEPVAETHWRDDRQLMGMVQNLLEAQGAGDGDFALKIIDQELGSVLDGQGVTRVDYSRKTAHLFDSLPALGESETRQAAPALMVGDTVIRRGTIWAKV